MVGMRNFGRLGNYLYQMAATISYALKNGLEYSAPNDTINPTWCPLYLQHLVNPKWRQGREDVLINEVWTENQHYQHIPFKEEWRNQQIALNGYWQSFRYIDPYRDEIIKAFGYPYELNKGVCSIHIRRGDYLIHNTKHPTVTREYIWVAIGCMLELTKCENYLIHSDDIAWCRREFEINPSNCKFEFSEKKTPEEDLISMANCEHNICSNSTLALWGAELNQNPNKIVIVPDEENWFGKDNKHLSVKDLIRPEYIRIKYTPIYDL